jgi:hypothetical protein
MVPLTCALWFPSPLLQHGVDDVIVLPSDNNLHDRCPAVIVIGTAIYFAFALTSVQQVPYTRASLIGSTLIGSELGLLQNVISKQ